MSENYKKFLETLSQSEELVAKANEQMACSHLFLAHGRCADLRLHQSLHRALRKSLGNIQSQILYLHHMETHTTALPMLKDK